METDNSIGESSTMKAWRIVVLVLGALLIGLGMWALGGGIIAAWELFRDPDSIAYFARYFSETTKIATLVPKGGEGLAHYAAWIAVILLLLVIGKLGAWSLEAGARLLYGRPRKGAR